METKTATLIDVDAQNMTQCTGDKTSCKCGCAPCQETCCTLECQVQPRFFCGQLLTDADLTQLLNWTQGKFRLKRYVEGWGIVCGLEVKLDPKHPDHVIVLPGYAIDCCGRDVVLCDPVPFDLSAACPPGDCLVPGSRWPKAQTRPSYAQPGKQYESAETNPQSNFFPTKLYGQSKQYNLYLSYQTEETDLQTALRRDVCSQAAACEASRLKESSSLTFQLVNSDLSEESERVQELRQEYDDLAAPYLQWSKRAADLANKDVRALAALFQSLIDKRPLQEFGFVRDWINDPDTQLDSDWHRILFMFYLDALRAWVRCGCPACGPDHGVLLGQVSIVGSDGIDSGECRVIFVDDDSRWRRSLRKAPCFPATPGCTNLMPYLFKAWSDIGSEVQSLLKDRYWAPGLNIALKTLTVEQLNDVLNCRLVTTCFDETQDNTIQPVVVDLDKPWGQRVVGFRLYTT